MTKSPDICPGLGTDPEINASDPASDLFYGEPRSAWRAAIGATLAVVVVYGIVYSYGQVLGPLGRALGADEASGAVIFSITSLLGFGLSIVTGPLTDRFGARPLVLAGAVLMGAGLLLTAGTQTIWLAYLWYGVGLGASLACIYVPALAEVGRRFEKRRALATGLVVTGVGVGTLTGPPLTSWLIETLGWREAYTVLGLGGAGALFVSALLISPGARTTVASGKSVETSEARVGHSSAGSGFILFYAATLLLNIVIYVPYVHLSLAAQAHGVAPLSAAALVSVIGACNISGRLAVAALATRLGPWRLFSISHLGFALAFAIWLVTESFAGFALFAMIAGASHGLYSALLPMVTADRFGTAHLGRRLGILFTALGFGSAIGPPLTGYLVQAAKGYSLALVALSGIALLAALVLSLMPNTNKVRPDHGA